MQLLDCDYSLAESDLIIAARIYAEQRSEQHLRCCQLLAVSAFQRSESLDDATAEVLSPMLADSRIQAAITLGQWYTADHNDVDLGNAVDLLRSAGDPFLTHVLDQVSALVSLSLP